MKTKFEFKHANGSISEVEYRYENGIALTCAVNDGIKAMPNDAIAMRITIGKTKSVWISR